MRKKKGPTLEELLEELRHAKRIVVSPPVAPSAAEEHQEELDANRELQDLPAYAKVGERRGTEWITIDDLDLDAIGKMANIDAGRSEGGQNKESQHADADKEAADFEKFRRGHLDLSRSACARIFPTTYGRSPGRNLLRRVAAAKERAAAKKRARQDS